MLPIPHDFLDQISAGDRPDLLATIYLRIMPHLSRMKRYKNTRLQSSLDGIEDYRQPVELARCP